MRTGYPNYSATIAPVTHCVTAFYVFLYALGLLCISFEISLSHEGRNVSSSPQSSAETKLERQESLTRDSPALHQAPETQWVSNNALASHTQTQSVLDKQIPRGHVSKLFSKQRCLFMTHKCMILAVFNCVWLFRIHWEFVWKNKQKHASCLLKKGADEVHCLLLTLDVSAGLCISIWNHIILNKYGFMCATFLCCWFTFSWPTSTVHLFFWSSLQA